MCISIARYANTNSVLLDLATLAKILFENYHSNGFTISSSYETLIFSDLQEMLLKRKTLDEHYNSMLTTIGTSYKGLDKFAYGNENVCGEYECPTTSTLDRYSKKGDEVSYLVIKQAFATERIV